MTNEPNTTDSRLVSAIEDALMKHIREGCVTSIPYDQRFKIPDSFLRRLYDQVDMNKVLDAVKPLLEERIAELILGSLATEVTSDVKQLLSHKERRECLRAIVRENMDRIVNAGGKI